MATRTVDGKKLHFEQLASKGSDVFKKPAWTEPPPATIPEPGGSSQTIITRTEVAPKTRIVVVRTASRTASGTQENESDKNEIKEEEKNSAQLPPLLTNGRTSVYLIRRPIPSNEPARETKMFKSSEEDPTIITTKTSTTKASRRNVLRKIEMTSDGSLFLPSEARSTASRRRKSSRRRNRNREADSPDSDEYIGINRSRSRSRTRREGRSSSKDRSNSRRRKRSRRRSQSRQSSPSSATREASKNTDKKHTAVQADLLSSETAQNQTAVTRKVRSLESKGLRRKVSPTDRTKSSKSIVLVNPEDQTIAVIENPYMKGDPVTPILHASGSTRKNYFTETTDNLYLENSYNKKPIKNACLNCLSNQICLVIILCIIFLIIGLGGIGASAYFLVNDSQSNFIPKIVGIIVGAVVAIIALCFLCCVLACIGSHYGYFSYNDDKPQIGGRAFAVIASNHKNSHRYVPYERPKITKTRRTSSPVHQLQTNTNRQRTNMSDNTNTVNPQRTTVSNLNSPTSSKNITIQLPERLLTARKVSPKSRENKMNDVVNNIGRVVEDAKKRYKGDLPTKVIVQVDENAKPKS